MYITGSRRGKAHNVRRFLRHIPKNPTRMVKPFLIDNQEFKLANRLRTITCKTNLINRTHASKLKRARANQIALHSCQYGVLPTITRRKDKPRINEVHKIATKKYAGRTKGKIFCNCRGFAGLRLTTKIRRATSADGGSPSARSASARLRARIHYNKKSSFTKAKPDFNNDTISPFARSRSRVPTNPHKIGNSHTETEPLLYSQA